MRRSFFLPIVTLLLLGAGCALSSVDSERAAKVEEYKDEATDTSSSLLPSATGENALIATDDVEEGGDDFASLVVTEPFVSEPKTVMLQAGNFSFEPSTIEAESGEVLMITFAEVIGEHHFVIEELGINEAIREGATLTITAPQVPGRYSYYCDVGAHRTLGMEGVLIVK